MSDIRPQLDRLATALGEAGQPQATLSALGDVLATAVGYQLFTVLVYDRGAGLIRRAFSTYPPTIRSAAPNRLPAPTGAGRFWSAAKYTSATTETIFERPFSTMD